MNTRLDEGFNFRSIAMRGTKLRDLGISLTSMPLALSLLTDFTWSLLVLCLETPAGAYSLLGLLLLMISVVSPPVMTRSTDQELLRDG